MCGLWRVCRAEDYSGVSFFLPPSCRVGHWTQVIRQYDKCLTH